MARTAAFEDTGPYPAAHVYRPALQSGGMRDTTQVEALLCGYVSSINARVVVERARRHHCVGESGRVSEVLQLVLLANAQAQAQRHGHHQGDEEHGEREQHQVLAASWPRQSDPDHGVGSQF